MLNQLGLRKFCRLWQRFGQVCDLSDGSTSQELTRGKEHNAPFARTNKLAQGPYAQGLMTKKPLHLQLILLVTSVHDLQRMLNKSLTTTLEFAPRIALLWNLEQNP